MTYIHTKPWALYNEIDEYAADWLENLIAAGLIANGVVDRRSIEDIRPDELRGFRQVHFFAGIGVWSYAFRRAGISDDTALWTGSCPCQPFSAAGKGGGVDDERHLWPAFYHLIRECRPSKVYGEQVASKDGLGWLDIVSVDLERAGYAFGAVDTCSASVGAPHIRQRLRFHAYDLRPAAGGLQHATGDGRFERGAKPSRGSLVSGRSSLRMADCDSHEPRQGRDAGSSQGEGVRSQSGGCGQSYGMDNDDDAGLEGFGSRHQTSIRHWQGSVRPASAPGELGGLGHTDDAGSFSGTFGRIYSGEEGSGARNGEPERPSAFGGLANSDDGQLSVSRRGSQGRNGSTTTDAEFVGASPTNGFWRDADWLFCRDGRWRPVRSSAQQMVDGSTRSMGPLRSEDIRKVEEAVEQWSQRHETDATEAVRNLWDLVSEEEVRLRPDGGFDSLREAPFLLAFMRQLSNQGWKFPIGDERASSEASRTVLRVLRFTEQPSYTSRGRGLDEQQSGEPANPLRFLSQILAYHTEVCWRDTGWQDVGSFPLAHNVPSRVGRLRAYGNAVDAEATREFIEATLEHETLDLVAAGPLFEDILG